MREYMITFEELGVGTSRVIFHANSETDAREMFFECFETTVVISQVVEQ